jgi:PRTRC genetic system protein B
MNNITHLFNDIYYPVNAIVLYQNSNAGNEGSYIEAFDMDNNGKPINAHPLSSLEVSSLAQALASSADNDSEFLHCKGLLPEHLLYWKAGANGMAVWFTPPQKVKLLFKESLNIPCGEAWVPALVWKATKENLCLYAIKGNNRPTLTTKLFQAPFFNLYENDSVCMGTVNVEIDNDCDVASFMSSWQTYFWNSYFSYLIGGALRAKTNIVQLWKEQVTEGKPFPNDQLVKHSFTIQNLIHE